MIKITQNQGGIFLIYYLAIDIGASSGRHILGSLSDGKLKLEEIYRFENYLVEDGSTLVWDIDNLVNQVLLGIKKCSELGKIPSTVAIDTWGVDYVLLDSNKKEILPAVSYRDSRTFVSQADVAKILPQSVLYKKTGIQKQNYNTIYQLYADKLSGKLEKASYFLMMPEYLSFKLTGVIKNEYTNATTTNLVNANTKTWDEDILDTLGIQKDIFGPISTPPATVGTFTKAVEDFVGFNANVLLCPSHDTASAVAACPVSDNSVYISSGTWSLIGTENLFPVLTNEALAANFTNEGGIEYRFRFLKNIMGMWLFQNIRKNINKSLTYDQMMHLAQKSNYKKLINPNAPEFLAPENMIDAIKAHLNEPNLELADLLSSVYHSLASSYAVAIKEIEKICNKKIDSIHIVGGGSKDVYLNKLTNEYTGKKVYIGLSEATATGNIISQIMYFNKISLNDARDIIIKTFNIKEI